MCAMGAMRCWREKGSAAEAVGRKLVCWGLALGALAVWTGCGGNSSSQNELAEEAAAYSAQETLQQMVAKYQAAKSYADSGDAYFSAARLGVATTDQPLPFSCTYERPGKARLHLFDAGIVIDGKQIWATVRHVAGQILQQPAPNSFVLELLPQDPILAEAMHRGLPLLQPTPLLLLANPDALEVLLLGAEAPEMLAEDETQERQCYRVQIKRPTSSQVLWIDKESLLLRRIDYAGAEIQRRLNPDGQLSNLKVWVEFSGAQLNPDFKTDPFQFSVPPEARLVKRFVAPVMAPPPSLGQKVGDFTLYASRDSINRGNLVDRTTVLCFWSTSDETARGILPELELLKTKYKDSDQVQFFAVGVDPSVVKPEKLRETLRNWGSSLPLARDPDGSARAAMFADQVPTVLVIGGDARVHEAQTGAPFDVGAVDRAIAGLLGGNDVATYLLQQYRELNTRFLSELEKVAVAEASAQVDIPQATIAQRNEPTNVRMEQLWSNTEIKQPGNVLVIPTETGPARVLVFDGWRAIVEVGPAGETLGRHEIDMPEGAVSSYLRTAVDGDGRRWFAASAVNQQQLFLLDEAFQTRLKYPEERHPGIGDAQLADLAGNGQLALILGYWGTVGVQGVSLTGERLWNNRSVENVLQIVIGGAKENGQRNALCYSTRGTLLPIDAQGEAGPEIRIPNRTLTTLAAEDVNGDGQVEICALAIDPKNLGRYTAIGLDEAGTELWSYAMPPGNHNYVVERIVPARLGVNDGGWLLPGPDGSIHLLTANGELVDRFHYGAAITGLGMAQHGDAPVLVISTPDTFTAWKLTPRDVAE